MFQEWHQPQSLEAATGKKVVRLQSKYLPAAVCHTGMMTAGIASVRALMVGASVRRRKSKIGATRCATFDNGSRTAHTFVTQRRAALHG